MPPILLSLLFILCSVLPSKSQNDSIYLGNSIGAEPSGLLVDCAIWGTQNNDVRHNPSGGWGDRIDPCSLGVHNEILAWIRGRPPAIRQNVPWTDGYDLITVMFQNEIAIDAHVWIVFEDAGVFAEFLDILTHLAHTSNTWFNERMGLDWGNVGFTNATTDPDAPTYEHMNINCTQQAGIEADIGRMNNMINIYYVNTAFGATTSGFVCAFGGEFIAMGTSTNQDLLVHEMGHNFTLEHPAGAAAPFFNVTGVMAPASATREFFSEGQSFRAHFTPHSAINDTYNGRPGQPTRTCGQHNTTATNTCPSVQRRIWADGTFAANKQLNGLEFLDHDCADEQEKHDLALEIIANAAEIKPKLEAVLQEGLSDERIAFVRAAAKVRYDQLQHMLNVRKPKWVTPEYDQALRSITEAQYLNRAVEQQQELVRNQAEWALSLFEDEAVELPNALTVELFPNVASDHVNVRYYLPREDPAVITITDMSGRQLLEEKLTGQTEGWHLSRLSTEGLANGVYLYRVQHSDLHRSGKLVIRR